MTKRAGGSRRQPPCSFRGRGGDRLSCEPAQIAAHVGGGQSFQRFGNRAHECAGLGGIVEGAVRVRAMIALDRVQNTDGVVFVLRYAEPDGVGAMAFRKMGAAAAGVAQIAAILYGRLVRLPGATGVGAAESRVEVAQAAARSGQPLAGIEVGTGHGRYISMEHMAVNRLEVLKSLVAQNPNDNFARYGLAMEYANRSE